MQVLGFIVRHIADIAFIVVFAIVLWLFLREFNFTSRRSWAMLVGFSLIGFMFSRRINGRSKLLNALKKREEELNGIEKEYGALKKQYREIALRYDEIKGELDRAKIESARALADLSEKKNRRIEEIEKEFESATPDEAIKAAKELIKKYENR